MGRRLESLNPFLTEFIENQKMFFVATAMQDGTINLSPKGLDSLRVMDPNRVLWLNLTGSGNETAIHLSHHNRITLMFCAFEGDPMILRLYGKAKVYGPKNANWEEHIGLFPKIAGSRQLVDMEIEKVQTSCGMGVPFMDYKSDRQGLLDWAEQQGDEGLERYWRKKNTTSIDGVKANED
ncbi:pyridoxamine 5'-phosphate oxidase family protein [Flagellimonas myxillae]|uniref:pyridoxamine 5'-phosphate oxidase family protein n=1 Tax=Flagellimonas myxillae TaxID=2942214 RepID=UPI00201E9C1C|nr:pyridoxamine 5'-phosphate oxidase family protein [Muricauda myxillae]MCL6267942.1 pyridoxamine 5'-phosphate oxidase family protein [Muricauda myxillae]